MSQNGNSFSRRQFIAGAGAAAAFTIAKPSHVKATSANSKINIGIIGVGGRGSWIAGLFKDNGNYNIIAVSDYFQDRVDACGSKFNLPESRRFTGLSNHEKLLAVEGLDAVAIISPPYFHPEQAAAAVDAGKHVYIAKPVAVDAPGCLSIGQSGRKATDKEQVFLVDFQTRADRYFKEALKRVHDGAIGEYAFGESSYHAGDPFRSKYKYLQDDPNNAENRLRAWGLDRVLSGDIITEQNIHTLDVASWIMNSDPLWAVGTGERKVRKFGTCCDTFSLFFQYPDNVGVSFTSRQFDGHGSPGGINNRMFGDQGVLETSYGGQVLIRGENFYRGGKSPAIYKEGAQTNIADFHKAIVSGDWSNTTVPESVRSNLVTVLGRTAAYRNEKVTFKQLISEGEKLEADLAGLKA